MSKYRPVSERINDFQLVELRMLDEELRAMECQDCGIPYCHGVGCPLMNVIPEINDAAKRGHWDMALALLLSTSPFPEFTAYVCPALCEGSCVQGLNRQPVPCRLIELEVIERGFAFNLIEPQLVKQRMDLNVAVIGSGPAGLAAAWALNQGGARVTIYEKDLQPGGFLRYGIPDFKLPKHVIDRRIALLQAEGITFESGVEAGLDISTRLLKGRHDVLLLANGARRKRDLAIPGRDLAGIHFAVDYLSAQNRLLTGEIKQLPYSAQGRQVVVIGGGDTGSDCVGTAWRQGASQVTQLEIMPQPPFERATSNPWPQWPLLLRSTSSHEEGGIRRWNTTTLEFLPRAEGSGELGALLCQQVDWSGGQGPQAVAGSELLLPADMVLLAMGFTGVEHDKVLAELGITPDSYGRLAREQGYRLSEDVYACGDACNGPSLVVRAISDGLDVARAVLKDYN